MDHYDDGEALFGAFVDDAAFEPANSQPLPTAAGRNVATCSLTFMFLTASGRSVANIVTAAFLSLSNAICHFLRYTRM